MNVEVVVVVVVVVEVVLVVLLLGYMVLSIFVCQASRQVVALAAGRQAGTVRG